MYCRWRTHGCLGTATLLFQNFPAINVRLLVNAKSLDQVIATGAFGSKRSTLWYVRRVRATLLAKVCPLFSRMLKGYSIIDPKSILKVSLKKKSFERQARARRAIPSRVRLTESCSQAPAAPRFDLRGRKYAPFKSDKVGSLFSDPCLRARRNTYQRVGLDEPMRNMAAVFLYALR